MRSTTRAALASFTGSIQVPPSLGLAHADLQVPHLGPTAGRRSGSLDRTTFNTLVLFLAPLSSTALCAEGQPRYSPSGLPDSDLTRARLTFRVPAPWLGPSTARYPWSPGWGHPGTQTSYQWSKRPGSKPDSRTPPEIVLPLLCGGPFKHCNPSAIHKPLDATSPCSHCQTREPQLRPRSRPARFATRKGMAEI